MATPYAAIPYAEVIGDPIAHSKSPLIHRFWLEKLGLKGDYRSVQVRLSALPAYLRSKRADPCWRGCNLTAPLKQEAARLVGSPAGLCDFVGAVNCITRTPLNCLIGTNTDLAGIAEALAGVELEGKEAVLIGAGGAARAALCYLVGRKPRRITMIARDPAKAARMGQGTGRGIEIDGRTMEAAGEPIERAQLIVNATPLGQAGAAPMPDEILKLLPQQAVVFDMVYDPIETPLLAAARQRGAQAIDGLNMLIGQAAPAFELFLGARAPRRHDAELRGLLTR